ncbi:hypothetical protein [Paenimyroides ceti]|nr:hypothetical protein [Paenimyroides ceti]
MILKFFDSLTGNFSKSIDTSYYYPWYFFVIIKSLQGGVLP